MPRAFVLIKEEPVYRRAAFVRGLEAVGYTVVSGTHRVEGRPGDALVIWNRYGTTHELAERFERAGGAVLVAENAYCANDRADRRRYALARDGHNGSGWWPYGDASRWSRLGIKLQPWRRDGEHVVVAANRSFGMPGFIMPVNWLTQTVDALRKHTKRPIIARPHPGNGPPRRPFAADLANAWAVVIWSSSVGVEALVAGVPVICTAPWWICKSATAGEVSKIEEGLVFGEERGRALERLAWAQWTVEEIESGEPFQHLLIDAPAFAGSV